MTASQLPVYSIPVIIHVVRTSVNNPPQGKGARGAAGSRIPRPAEPRPARGSSFAFSSRTAAMPSGASGVGRLTNRPRSIARSVAWARRSNRFGRVGREEVQPGLPRARRLPGPASVRELPGKERAWRSGTPAPANPVTLNARLHTGGRRGAGSAAPIVSYRSLDSAAAGRSVDAVRQTLPVYSRMKTPLPGPTSRPKPCTLSEPVALA